MGYAPLDFINGGIEKGGSYENMKNILIKSGAESLKGISDDDYVNAFISPHFMDMKANWKHEDLNKLLFINSEQLVQSLGATMDDVENGNVDLRTEWKDIYLGAALWDIWAKNKQVYQPDPYFTEALLHTTGFEMTKEQLMHLPVNTFYIDYSDVPMFEPIIGCLVDVRVDNEKVDVNEYLLAENMVYYSFYSGGYFDENGIIKMDFEKTFPEDKRKDYLIFDANLTGKKTRAVYDSVMSRTSVSIFGMQMILYLTSKEPDISENQITKSTYKPGKSVKNKFSEIQKWDVGIRFGKTIQSKLTENQDQKSKQNMGSENRTPTTEKKSRKSPSPHFRCAHWQRYWVGQGRKKCETRWIEPTFVGWNIDDKETGVVIHKVK